MQKKKKDNKPVLRVDKHATHGFSVRVRRSSWIGSRFFADRQYGGAAEARAAAYKWYEYAEGHLPTIPPKPVLKQATVRTHPNHKRPGLSYYDVYLPSPVDDRWFVKKLYPRTLSDQRVYLRRANQLAEERNSVLRSTYDTAISLWQIEHDKITEKINDLWPSIQGLQL